jgi:HEAT repeat protein
MTSINEIQDFISQKKYVIAIDQSISFMKEAMQIEDKENLSLVLEIINAICDKTDITIEKTLSTVRLLLDYTEYWVKQDALEICEKLFKNIANPQKFDFLIEKIEEKLFDSDKKVREAAVSLVSLILTKSFTQYPGLYLTFSRMFEDHSWTVRAKALEGVIKFLKPESNPSSEMIDAFLENNFTLLRDPDEEVRGLAAEVLRALCYHMHPTKIIDTLTPVLKDVDWAIREKSVWIIGEIGHISFEELIPLFKILIMLFTDEVMIIQTKVIDAFVKIGKYNGPDLLSLFLPFINELEDDINQGISETLIYISLEHTRVMLPALISQLHNNLAAIRHLIGNCLMKIYMETPDGIEEELFRMFQRIMTGDWRQRLKEINLLGNLTFILRIHSIAIWTTINLLKAQESESDLDVVDEIKSSLSKIRNVFENIDKDIEEVERKKKFYYEEMDILQKLPQKLRTKAEDTIRTKKFNKAEILLEEEGNQISERINEFEERLLNSEFKRFSVDVLQDFADIKEEIYENVSDVKSVMYNIICDSRVNYIEHLEKIINNTKDRISVLSAEYESVKQFQIEFQDIAGEEDSKKTETFLKNISSLREKIYKLEFDIGQIWLNNLEFKEFLKEITLLWIEIKIEIQQYLSSTFQKFRQIHGKTAADGKVSSLKKKISFEFLNREMQNQIIQAIQSQRDVLSRFDKITAPVYEELKKHNFKEAKYLVNLTINNLHSQIENYNNEINNIYQEIDNINLPISTANNIRQNLNNWNEVKDTTLKQVQSFKNEIETQILKEEIKEYLNFMNPIPLKQLSKIISIKMDVLQEKLFELIKSHEIHAEIRNNELIQPEKGFEEKFLSFFRKIEIIGTKLEFSLRIYNPTKFFINNVNLIFTFPEYLKIKTNESDPNEIYIREFEPKAIRLIHWNFKIEQSKNKRYDLQKFLLNVSYHNPFNEITTFIKEMDIIL